MDLGNLEAVYPLSLAQAAILAQIQDGDGRYLCGRVGCNFAAPLDVEALEEAMRRLVCRHPILRSSFAWKRVEKPLQLVHKEVAFGLEKQDWRSLPADQNKAQLDRLGDDKICEQFDPSKAPLFHLGLYRTTEDNYRFSWTYHNLLLDQASAAALLEELLHSYDALRTGREPALQNRRPFRDYVVWLKVADLSKAETFWRNSLAGFSRPECEIFSAAESDSSSVQERWGSARLDLDSETGRKISSLVERRRISSQTLLIGALGLALSRYYGKSDFLAGLSVSSRTPDLPDSEAMLGPLTQTLPLRVLIKRDEPVVDWLERLHAQCSEIKLYGHCSISEICEWVPSLKGITIESIFSFEADVSNSSSLTRRGGLSLLTNEPADLHGSLIKVEVRLEPLPGLDIVYDRSRMTDSTAARLIEHAEALIDSIIERPAQALRELPVLPKSQLDKQLIDWNKTRSEYPSKSCIHQIFEEQADLVPDAVAVVFGDEQVTYAELNHRSNQLAHYLISLGVQAEVRVGICLDRSIEMIIGLIGILKAGGAYVPLDPAYPEERLSFMLADTQLPILLSKEGEIERLPSFWAQVVCLDSDWEQIAAESDANPVCTVTPDNIAYVDYTSGSTGTPKGVEVRHRGVARLLFGVDYVELSSSSRLLHLSPISFDASTFEVWGGLLHGGRCVLMGERMISARELEEVIKREGVETMWLTSSLYNAVVDERVEALEGVKQLLIGGEALSVEHVLKGQRSLRGTEIINGYGPTESTTFACCYRTGEGRVEGAKRIPIGSPIGNTTVYLMNEEMELAPAGVTGEMYIGGDGLARGYLNRAELTAERFIPDPASEEGGGRLYKTGDLGRYLEDGRIEFVGRRDHQVKIRGYRIELGEIEAALEKHPRIESVIVEVREEEAGDKRLVAYVVGAEEDRPTVGELRSYLKERLPEYMAPSVYVLMDRLPLGPNGKVDRKALPAPDNARPDLVEQYIAPETATQIALARIWAEVLGVERVGINDNFFELGGDSIRSIQVRSFAQKAGLEFSIQDMFERQTLGELAEVAKLSEATSVGASGIKAFGLVGEEDRSKAPDEVEDVYPLSRLQAGMLFHSDFNEGSAVYHDIFSFHLEAVLDINLLQHAIDRLVARHAVLRTAFDLSNYSEPLQLVHKNTRIVVEEEDLRELGYAEQETELARWLDDEKKRHIDWKQPGLLRVKVFPRSEASFQFALSFHHAILDGWSVASLLTELFRTYLALIEGKEIETAPPPPAAFRDFIALELEAINSEDARRYWDEKLSDATFIRLPRIGQPAAQTSAQSKVLPIQIAPELSEQLKELARSAGVPVKSVLLAAHLKVMSLFAGRPDVMTGMVSNGRPEEAGGDQVLGLFLNTLPLRVQLPTGSWIELVRGVFDAERAWMPYRRYPMASLQKMFGSQPLFETAFNFTHFHVYEGLKDVSGIRFLGGKTFEQTNFTLTANFSLDVPASQVRLRLDYDANQVSAEQIETIGGYYAAVLTAMTSQPAHIHTWAGLLSGNELLQLEKWSHLEVDHPVDLTVHRLFESWAAEAPDMTALVFEDEVLTSEELNAQANQLAHYLISIGATPETRIGICLPRSSSTIIAIIGVLKTGAAYVPLDPAYPQDRLEYMLEDCGAAVLISDSRAITALFGGRSDKAQAASPLPLFPSSPASLTLVLLDADRSQIALQSTGNPSKTIEPQSLAYMIYTSGSTGRPKGAMIAHKGLHNVIHEQKRVFGLTCEDRVLQLASLSFDASIFEIMLAAGPRATICVADQNASLPGPALTELIRNQAVTSVVMPPSLLGALQPAELSTIRKVLSVGEACTSETVALWGPSCDFFNAYGPTEVTIWASTTQCVADGSRPLIGKPIANAPVHIVDSNLNKAPAGVAGELCVGGQGLGRGYLNRPDVTADRFVPDPFRKEPGGRFYRTGDLARFIPDGRIDYLGRIDHQVKIRGYRIELGEIEAALIANEAVREAVVTAYEDRVGKRLVAYVAGNFQTGSAVTELRSHLKQRLPDYMTPSSFVFLEALPLTPNGKIDRKALPPPDGQKSDAGREYVAPVSYEEKILAEIWSKVMGVERVGVSDNFFELGGDSILSIQIVAKANQAGLRLTPKQLFENQTIAELAAAAGSRKEIKAEQGTVTGLAPLTPIQHWFFEQQMANPHHFNLSVLLQSQQQLDAGILKRAVESLLAHHDALRLRFPVSDAQRIQEHRSAEDAADFVVHQLAGVPDDEIVGIIEQRASEAQASLNIYEGPLVRVVLFDLGNERPSRLLLAVHHLVVDGVSWRILLEDLQTAYSQLLKGEELRLDRKTTSFKEWAERLEVYAQAESLQTELEYWLKPGRRPIKPLPVDLPGGDNIEAGAEAVSVSLTAERTRALLQAVPEAYRAQVNEALLTAAAHAISTWTGDRRVLIDLEGHGREELFEDLDVSRTVGWFTTLYPVLFEIRPEQGLSSSLKAVKEQLRAVPNRGIGYGLLRYNSKKDHARDSLSRLAQAQIGFNYLGQFDQVFAGDQALVPAAESTGSAHDPGTKRNHLLDVTAIITGGCLRVSWSFSAALHERATIERLAASFIESLERLIDECESVEEGSFTPSDFPLANLSESQLDKVLENFEFEVV